MTHQNKKASFFLTGQCKWPTTKAQIYRALACLCISLCSSVNFSARISLSHRYRLFDSMITWSNPRSVQVHVDLPICVLCSANAATARASVTVYNVRTSRRRLVGSLELGCLSFLCFLRHRVHTECERASCRQQQTTQHTGQMVNSARLKSDHHARVHLHWCPGFNLLPLVY